MATALDLNESNCKVFAGCLTRDGVDRFENDPKFQGMAFIIDVTKDEDVEKAKWIIKDNGGIQLLLKWLLEFLSQISKENENAR